MLNAKEEQGLIETEAHLIGGILRKNEFFDLLELSHEDFYDPLHREIYREIEGLVMSGRSCTPVDVVPRLPYEELNGTNVKEYIIHLLSSSAVMAMTLISYQSHIQDMSAKWKLHNLADEVLVHEGNSADMISTIEQGLSDISKSMSGREKSMDEVVESSLEYIQKIANGDEDKVSTGLIDLDQILGGFFPDELIILAGRPAMGKSTIANQLAMNLARQKFGSIFFNLEMSSDQMLGRIYTEMLFDVNRNFNLFYNKIRKGVNNDEMESICRVAHEFKSLPLILDDRPDLSLMTLKTRSRAYIRKLKARGIDTKVIFVDYLQLMQANATYKGQRVNEVSEITRGLKMLAKELGVTIVALSQLSRAVEARENKRPILADLRDSGSIEQDADIVLFAYRHEYYLNLNKPNDVNKQIEWDAQMQDCKDKMEIIVGKQRSGETGSRTVNCSMGASKIYNEGKDDE